MSSRSLPLAAAAGGAIVWANSPWSASYASTFGDARGWINDGLMAIFFLVVGLEIKRELVDGELASPRRAALPAVAALGGMIVPALLYVAVTAGTTDVRGWGIPMATDIALALGVVTALGSRVPPGAKVFLLALAIVDDIGAILVIAVAYSSDIHPAYLAGALGCAVVAFAVARAPLPPAFPVEVPLVALGVGMWWCLHHSGVHATIAGVVMGLIMPTHLIGRWERRLEPVTYLVIVPLFALANAGVAVGWTALGDAARSPVAWGIVLGLVVGKPLGILAAVMVGRRFGLELPDGLTMSTIGAVGLVAGIGFTVSIFVTDLALGDGPAIAAAKVGIVAASLVAAGAGTVAFRVRSAPVPR